MQSKIVGLAQAAVGSEARPIPTPRLRPKTTSQDEGFLRGKPISNFVGSILDKNEFDAIRRAPRHSLDAHVFARFPRSALATVLGLFRALALYATFSVVALSSVQVQAFAQEPSHAPVTTQELSHAIGSVIDGTAEQANALQASLAAKYPHLQGSKSAWEVRLLKRAWGIKKRS